MDGRGGVLVVDDDASIRLLVKELLRNELGVAVRGVADGGAAVRSVIAERPALVLLDLLLPNVDGLTVLRWLKARPDTALIPVLALTATRGSELDAALENGVDGFVLKPFDIDELVRATRPFVAPAAAAAPGRPVAEP